MKQRLTIFTAVAAVAAVMVMAPSSAGAQQIAVAEDATVSVVGIDPEDRALLGALVFGVGPLAAELGTEVSGFQGITEKEYLAQAAEVLSGFVQANELALVGVVNDIRSGDVNRVEAGLTDLAELYVDHAEEMIGAERFAAIQGKADSQPAACGVAIVCVAYAAAAVHNTVVITGLAAVVIGGAVACGVWWLDCSAGSTTNTTDARMEYFVADVTRAAIA